VVVVGGVNSTSSGRSMPEAINRILNDRVSEWRIRPRLGRRPSMWDRRAGQSIAIVLIDSHERC
jgi:hypothetical protein